MEIRKLAVVVRSPQITQNVFVSRSCFADDDKECAKICNARAQPFFCSLNLLFGSVLVAVAAVVCLSSLLSRHVHWRNVNIKSETQASVVFETRWLPFVF